MTNCRIKNVRFKKGGSLTVIPPSNHNVTKVGFGWGEVTFRAFDGKKLTIADCSYMADMAKHLLCFDEE